MVLGPSYTNNKTQTYNPVVNIKPLYLEIHSAGTHMCVYNLLGLSGQGSSSLAMSTVYWQRHFLSSDHTGNC